MKNYGHVFLVGGILAFLAVRPIPTLAQTLTSRPHIGVEQVPLDDEIYSFLRHLSVQGLIEGYSEAQLPYSEFEIAEFLRQVKPIDLSNSEEGLLRKYLRTFAHEPREAVTVFPAHDAEPFFTGGVFTDKDKYIYQWFDDSTNSDLFVHGVGSLEYRHKTSDGSVVLGTIGGRFAGTLNGHVGYFLQTTNGERFGDSALALEDPLLAKNRNLSLFTHQFYDYTSAELTYNSDWFTGKIAREAVAIGGGYQDNIILSSKVPNYDFISLGAHVGAVRYKAMFASLVADTSFGTDYPVKYMTIHDLDFFLGHDFELGFSDIMVFNKRVELGFLNPFSFLDVVKHGLDDNDEDNSLMGAHTRWRVTPGFELRGEMLLDDILASGIGKGWWGNKWAWQLGGMWAGAFGIRDLDWAAEWMHIEPYVYTHWNTDIDRYTTSQSVLGAQIGPNALSYWSQLRWTPTSKWTIDLEGQLVEKGENIYDTTGQLVFNAGGDYNVSLGNQGTESNTHFLTGRRVNITTVSLTLEYEPWRDIVLFARGTKKSVDYLSEAPQTPGVDLSGVAVSTAPREFPGT